MCIYMHVYIAVNPFHLVLRRNSPIKKKEVGFMSTVDYYILPSTEREYKLDIAHSLKS
jgi:hypothetical protein